MTGYINHYLSPLTMIIPLDSNNLACRKEGLYRIVHIGYQSYLELIFQMVVIQAGTTRKYLYASFIKKS